MTVDELREAAIAGRDMGGLAHLQAIASGEMPPAPIAVLLGFEPVEATEGRVVFACEPGPQHYNPIGVVHGGLAATLLDSAMGCAVQTLCGPGEGYTTLELKVNYVRAITAETGLVHAEGVIVHRGRTVATAEGKLVAVETGKLLAHATTTCLVIPATSGVSRPS